MTNLTQTVYDYADNTREKFAKTDVTDSQGYPAAHGNMTAMLSTMTRIVARKYGEEAAQEILKEMGII